MQRREIQVLIVGAGVAGLSLALALRRVGLEPVVVEQAEGVDASTEPLELWADGVAVLDWLGVGSEVRAAGTEVTTWSHRRPDGRVDRRLETTDGVGYVVVPYHRLCERLCGALSGRTVRTGTGVRSLERVGRNVRVEFDNGVREPFDLVVGADGARSTVRAHVGGAAPVHRGTTSLAFPLPGGTDLPGASEGWVSGVGVVGAVSTRERATGWATVPTAALADGDVPSRLAETLSEIEWLLPDGTERLDGEELWRHDDVGIEADTWTGDRVALVGDAAHARHRLAGVGATLAVEDAVVLTSEIAGMDSPLPERLDAYAARRRERLNALFSRPTRAPSPPSVGSVFDGGAETALDVRSARLAATFDGETGPAVDLP